MRFFPRLKFLLPVLLLLNGLLPTSAEPTHDWELVPGKRVGPINGESTLESLESTFGPDMVTRTSPPKEGSSAELLSSGNQWHPCYCAQVYAGDPEMSLFVYWALGQNGKAAVVQIGTYDKSDQFSVWSTSGGLSVGTKLTKLEELNGKPIRLKVVLTTRGYADKYDGYWIQGDGERWLEVESWEGGNLSSNGWNRILLGPVGGTFPNSLLSNDPTLQEENVSVTRIYVGVGDASTINDLMKSVTSRDYEPPMDDPENIP